jgi:hypothetical protein
MKVYTFEGNFHVILGSYHVNFPKYTSSEHFWVFRDDVNNMCEAHDQDHHILLDEILIVSSAAS